GERYDQYLRAKRGDIDIIIGPRSAVFMPFRNVGLIIIDEEHDGAYKNESVPRYHTRDIAIMRARIEGATVVLGSATPSVESYYRAGQGEYILSELKERAVKEARLPRVTVTDMREELKNRNRSIFSKFLKEKIDERLKCGEQVMLFLNRRGYAGFVSCRSCGYVLKCKHCEVSLTAHRNGTLKCHYCGSSYEMPKVCPKCGSKYIAAFGTGTQKVESLVGNEFPQARILRLDRDSAAKRGSMDEILEKFKNHEADILVGTQMIVKGHDFPNVTLVGVLAADLSLYAGDYMSSERTFQLITQAAGRAGRGGKPGEVVIQTYSPDNYSIMHAARQDYKAFYNEEIGYREALSYPPAYHMMVVLIECPSYGVCSEQADVLKKVLTEDPEETGGMAVIGPADAHVSKGRDIYRKTIYVKCRDEAKLLRMRKRISRMMADDDTFKNVTVTFDFDPMSMY
ncbi:MAG: primosomal protein N', partial [Lachnospiraceae bacterium]|nr:primosomal protein N' [Lachnospiraceae bacterium]